MNHLAFTKPSAAPLWHRFGKVGALAIVIASVATPLAQATNIDTQSLDIAPNGKLDLGTTPATTAGALSTTRNAVIVRASSAAAQTANINKVKGYVNSGNAGGLWTGNGVTSGTAANDAQINGVLSVMFYDNTQLGFPNFEGANLSADPNFNQVLLRTTYTGDFDASGKLDSSDYGLLDFYLASGLTRQGDITADGLINSLDYGLLDFTLSSQVYGPLGASVTGPSPAAAAAVPEPTSGLLSLFGAAFVASLRKRRQSK